MKQTQKIIAGTVAASLAIGGFTLGRMTQTDTAQAEPYTTPTPAVATPSGESLPSFATLAPQVSPAVVHIKVVSLERADFQPDPDWSPIWLSAKPVWQSWSAFPLAFPVSIPTAESGSSARFWLGFYRPQRWTDCYQ